MYVLWVCKLASIASERLVDLQRTARSAQPRTSDHRLVFFVSVTLDASKKQIQLKHQNRRPPGRESKHGSGHASLCFRNSLRPGVSVPPTRAAHLRHHEGVRRHLRPLLLLSNTSVLSLWPSCSVIHEFLQGKSRHIHRCSNIIYIIAAVSTLSVLFIVFQRTSNRIVYCLSLKYNYYFKH